MGESGEILRPVAGLSSISFMPLQKLPKESQSLPSVSWKAQGSMQLKSSSSRDWTTTPPSVQ